MRVWWMWRRSKANLASLLSVQILRLKGTFLLRYGRHDLTRWTSMRHDRKGTAWHRHGCWIGKEQLEVKPIVGKELPKTVGATLDIRRVPKRGSYSYQESSSWRQLTWLRHIRMVTAASSNCWTLDTQNFHWDIRGLELIYHDQA